jgi:hypothetical protein
MTVATSFGDLNNLQRELMRLLNDIRELRADKAPAAAHLKNWPLVDQWSLGLVPAPCIVGTMVGHPILRRVHTPQTVLIDTEAGWARTWTGFYRLGTRQV